MGGESLEKKWDQLSESDKHDTVQQVARWLKEIHSLELSHFGGLSEDDPKFDTWTEYLIYRATYDFEACQKDALLPASDLNAVLTIIKDRSHLLNKIDSPKLIHGDFHFGNILMNENKITAIIDWEWSFAGDPLFDFLVRSNINGECFDGFEVLTRAYDLKWPLSPEKHQMFRVYQLISAIELIWVSHRYLAPLYDWGKVQLQQKFREYELLKTEFLND